MKKKIVKFIAVMPRRIIKMLFKVLFKEHIDIIILKIHE